MCFSKQAGTSKYPGAHFIYFFISVSSLVLSSISKIRSVILLFKFPGNLFSISGISSFLIQFLKILLSKFETSFRKYISFSYAYFIICDFEILIMGLIMLSLFDAIEVNPFNLVPRNKFIKNVSILSSL